MYFYRQPRKHPTHPCCGHWVAATGCNSWRFVRKFRLTCAALFWAARLDCDSSRFFLPSGPVGESPGGPGAGGAIICGGGDGCLGMGRAARFCIGVLVAVGAVCIFADIMVGVGAAFMGARRSGCICDSTSGRQSFLIIAAPMPLLKP